MAVAPSALDLSSACTSISVASLAIWMSRYRSRMCPTFLKQNAFEKRILVPEHQALICCCSMILLQTLKGFLMLLDGSLQLLDVFCSSFPKRSLSLAISLLAFFRCRVNLRWHFGKCTFGTTQESTPYRLAPSFPLLHLGRFLGQALLLGFRGGFREGFLLEVFDLGDRGNIIDS